MRYSSTVLPRYFLHFVTSLSLSVRPVVHMSVPPSSHGPAQSLDRSSEYISFLHYPYPLSSCLHWSSVDTVLEYPYLTENANHSTIRYYTISYPRGVRFYQNHPSKRDDVSLSYILPFLVLVLLVSHSINHSTDTVRNTAVVTPLCLSQT